MLLNGKSYLFVCVIITVSLSLVDGWKLRDLSQKNDENKVLPKKPIFRDIPMRKVVKIERIRVKSGESGEDDDGVVTDDDDDGDFTFEKVHTTNFDLPSRPLVTLNNPDVEQEEEERIEEAAETEKMTSWFSHLTNLNIFSEKKEDEGTKPGDDESSGYFGWLMGANQESTDDDDKDSDETSWFSYLKSTLADFTDLLSSDDTSSVASDKKRRHKSEEVAPEKREPLTTQSFENLLLSIPSFIPNYTKINDVDCRRMGQIFQRQVRGQKLWALQMMDASAKIPSGLLRGNANQLGDFDLCTGIRTKVKIKDDKSVKIKGKYCLANIDVVAEDEQLKMSIHLLQGRNFLRSRLEDPSHFLPRYSTLKWALCIPHGCSSENALEILNEFLLPFNSTGVKIYADIDDNSCYVKSQKSWSNTLKENWQVAATVGYFTFFIVVAVVASLKDYWKILKLDVLFAPDKKKDNSKEETNDVTDDCVESVNEEVENDNDSTQKGATKFLMTFSIKRTSKILFNFDYEDSTFCCIDGLKGLATVPLFLSLKLLTFGHLPFTNKAQLTKMLNSSLSIFLRASFLFMDVFLLASGFYAGYKLSKDLKDHNHRIAWFRRIVGRFIRLFPSMVAAISFSAWILPYLGSGPQWGPLIEENSDLCQESFWKSIFFVQNFFPAQEQCSPHLQQIAIDCQLFLIAPIIVYYLDRNAVVGFGLFGALNALSVAMRYSSALSERLSFVIFQGMKLSQFYRTLDISFNSTVQRSTSYLIGLVLGVLLFNLNDIKRDIRIPKGILAVGWLTCIWSLIWCFWIPSDLSNKDYVYEPLDAAVFAAWAPLVWSLAISWIIFVIFIENGEYLRRLLTVRPLLLLNKISYQMFFVQFLVLFYNTASVRNGETFRLGSFISYTEISAIVGISIVSTVLFDLPFREISKILTTYTDAVVEESAASQTEDVAADDQKNVDNDIDEIWNNESHNNKVTFADDDEYSKRSFTPVWKKSDDEKPVWGDDEDENDADKAAKASNPESEPEDEESNSEEEEEEDISSGNE
ncbi:O-acyltransferase like protein-like [Bradysia coprophila]|uniref:O-acyltransferase like protein-like n=1 Tax=Bradysia coprophila TaxID=38358 RepID=UPI00187D89BB|nr:O-acyltransferase like protein-like [Bradysia coprophila]